MLIVYEGYDEVIITTKKLEDECVEELFDDQGRCLDDYNRKEIDDSSIIISSTLYIR